MRLSGLLLGVALLAGPAWAAPQRLAIVYGHNGGAGPRHDLRFAQADAQRLAAVLAEVGGVSENNLKLLTGRPLSELTQAFAWAKARSAENPESVLIVYLSSHADAKLGLLPGDERLDWAKLKALIASTGAKVRVAIVDGCQSSGLLEASARAAPTFTIAVEDRLTVKGEAFITSSASDEPSLEAGQFQGSVFSQHLVAALRGAADRSGAGRVSLEEAYRFAYERTTEGQSGQHPGFGTRLQGFGELFLTSLTDRAGLLVPPGIERIAVRGRNGDRLVSARRPEAARLVIPPGTWTIEVEQAGALRAGAVTVSTGFASIDLDRLNAVARQASLARLDSSLPCHAVRARHPDPALLRLVDTLTEALPGCLPDQAPATTWTFAREGAQVTLVAEMPSDSDGFKATRPPSESAALVDEAKAWVAGRLANSAVRKRNP